MRLFDLPAAQAFASRFSATSVRSRRSPGDILFSLSKQRVFKEGTDDYAELRDAMLRHADVGLLLSASNVRRSLEMMRTVAAPWAQVTLYYSAWHAGSAVLSMLGGFLQAKWWLGVDSANVGQLALMASRKQLNAERGPHQRFWRSFYDGLKAFEPWIDSSHKKAANPANGDPLWMITERKLVNYNHDKAEEQASTFASSFDANTFPSCLSGSLATQYQVTVDLLDLAFWLASEVGLKTDALNRIGPGLTRQAVVSSLILNEPLPGIDEPRLQAICSQ